jgi:hypothetical protein
LPWTYVLIEKRAVVLFFTLKASIHEIFTPNLYLSLDPMHSFCKHSINGINASLKGERSLSMIRDLDNLYRIISSKPFTLSFRNILLLRARDFVPTSGL